MATSLERFLAYAVLGREAKRHTRKRRRGMLALTIPYVNFPDRDEKYKAWIRTQRCCGCGSCKSEAAHTGDDGGKAMKASDRSCVPLCHRCHVSGRKSYHRIGKRAFEALYMIDLSAMVQKLNTEYDAMKAGIRRVVDLP